MGKISTQLESINQLKPGSKIEEILSGQKFVVLSNLGNRVFAVQSIALVTVNDHAHTEWRSADDNRPLNKLKVGEKITNGYTFIITDVSDYILHACRSIEVTNPLEFYLLD